MDAILDGGALCFVLLWNRLGFRCAKNHELTLNFLDPILELIETRKGEALEKYPLMQVGAVCLVCDFQSPMKDKR